MNYSTATFSTKIVEGKTKYSLTWLSSGASLFKHFWITWFAVQILDKHYNMKAERNDDRMDLSIVSKISLNPLPGKCGRLNKSETRLACLRVERKSIIFWTARVPCILREILTRSWATDSQMTLRCSSVEYSNNLWQVVAKRI
jgi:hypothetical protein